MHVSLYRCIRSRTRGNELRTAGHAHHSPGPLDSQSLWIGSIYIVQMQSPLCMCMFGCMFFARLFIVCESVSMALALIALVAWLVWMDPTDRQITTFITVHENVAGIWCAADQMPAARL